MNDPYESIKPTCPYCKLASLWHQSYYAHLKLKSLACTTNDIILYPSYRSLLCTDVWYFCCSLIKGFVKINSNFWFQLMVREMEIHFFFSKATWQNTPFWLQTSFIDDIIIGILFVIEWGAICVYSTTGLLAQDLRHNVLKTCVWCFLVCGHFSFLQVIAISKTISCQGAAVLLLFVQVVDNSFAITYF